MNRVRRLRKLVLGMLCLAGALPVHATFPGKNGRIAFVFGPDIYTMNSDGSDVKQLTHLPSDSGAFWESWSPDGKQLVFNEFRPPDFRGELWLMNADGSNQHLLLAAPDFDDTRASFTPDGSSVVFTRCRLDIDACALHQIRTDGTGLRSVTDFELGIEDKSAKYSPDNDGSLAFTGFARGGIGAAIYLDTQESSVFQLTPAPLLAEQPDWSPDGRSIAFSTHCCNPQNQEIWVTNVAGNALHRLTNNGDYYLTDPHDFHPSWSPQGDAIVFERDAPDFSSSAIFIMRADGSGSKELMELPNAARSNAARSNVMRFEKARGASSRRMAKRSPREIEAGGALPRWGAMPN
jgi:Tol biopolymer transport system component